MKVEKLMTRNVAVCRPADSLNDAARALWENDVGCLPVVDTSGAVVGVLTDRDVCMAAYFTGQSLASVRVESAMARGVRSCKASDSVEQVLETLTSHLVHRLPVVDGSGKLVGLVSVFDLARVAESGDVKAKDVVRSLAAIHEPRKKSAPIEKPAPALPKSNAAATRKAGTKQAKTK